MGVTNGRLPCDWRKVTPPFAAARILGSSRSRTASSRAQTSLMEGRGHFPSDADGSGRIVGYESRSKEEYLFDFDAGIGPRPIRQTANRGACVWAWMPMTADAAAAAAAEARKATWKARREMVTGTDCGAPRNFSMEVRRGVLRIINDRGGVFALADYSTGLKPDGSGKLVAKSDSGEFVTWEFAAGQGPRGIRMKTNEKKGGWR